MVQNELRIIHTLQWLPKVFVHRSDHYRIYIFTSLIPIKRKTATF